MLLQLPIALLLVGSASALPSPSAPEEPLSPYINRSIEVTVGNGGVLTQCSPVNFTWSAAIKREGSTGTFEGDYIASLETRTDGSNSERQRSYEQRTFAHNASRVWEWGVDVEAGTQVTFTVGTPEPGEEPTVETMTLEGVTDTLKVMPSSNDTCIPAANRPINFDLAQLDSLRSCKPIELSWSGRAPPYGVSIIGTNTRFAPQPFDLGRTNKTSITWDVALPAGANFMVAIGSELGKGAVDTFYLSSPVQLKGETGNCTIRPENQLVSAASASSVLAFWVVLPAVLLVMIAV